MFRKMQSHAVEFITDVNNFLKNEAEIITDFKTRLSNGIREIEAYQSKKHITYNRIINKMSELECTQFLADESLFMEENY